MSDSTAFVLTDEAKESDFSGGTCALAPDGETYDVKAALDKGNGVIETTDQRVIDALSAYPSLRPVREDEQPKAAPKSAPKAPAKPDAKKEEE